MSDKKDEKKEEAVQQPQPLTDEQTYADTRPATDPRVTHRAETEEQAKKREEDEKKGGAQQQQHPQSQPQSGQASTKGDDKGRH